MSSSESSSETKEEQLDRCSREENDNDYFKPLNNWLQVQLRQDSSSRQPRHETINAEKIRLREITFYSLGSVRLLSSELSNADAVMWDQGTALETRKPAVYYSKSAFQS